MTDISISSLLTVIDLARKWFSRIRAANREDVEKYQRALEPFYTALNETKIFIGSVKELGRDRQREEKLSRLWNEASLHLLPYNTDLAARCHFKAEYWANPSAWSDEKLKKARIEIDRVAKEAQKLLAKKGR